MLFIGDPKSPSLFPQQELFSSRNKGVTEVYFQFSAIRISVLDCINNLITWELVGTVLNEVTKSEGFIVGDISTIQFTLNG